jgi:hypothetical protein
MPTKSETFKKFPNEVFIETGSFMGDGIQNAIDAGFKKIISIELSDKYFEISTKRFENNSSVTIFKGDSYKVLPTILEDINTTVTFWLDGHHSCGDTALGDYWAPLIQELHAIKNHRINNHTIIIDDMRCWEEPNPVHGFYKEDLFKILKEININYKFEYEDGSQKNDVLIAHL